MLNSEGKLVFASHGLNIPVLFLVFNRLDTTKQVFEAIRKAAPRRLYVASDGPRDNRTGETEKVSEVRDYVLKSVDWDCEIKTLFREENLGCGKNVSESISWFFKQEEMGIILEDDCLPSNSFFLYCEELLERYKNNNRIYHIAGYNPLTIVECKDTYYFTRNQYCWGWASWRRAWSHYSYDINDLDKFIVQKKIKNIFNRLCDRIYWLDIFRQMEKHKIDTWDYQWTYSIFNNDGICIAPTRNMVRNIGFGIDATHTLIEDTFHNEQEVFEIETIIHPDRIILDVRINNALNKNVTTLGRMIKRMIKDMLRLIYRSFFPRTSQSML
jgi:hypothetical protein